MEGVSDRRGKVGGFFKNQPGVPTKPCHARGPEKAGRQARDLDKKAEVRNEFLGQTEDDQETRKLRSISK